MASRWVLLGFSLIAFSIAISAHGESTTKPSDGKIIAVQKRRYVLKEELTPNVSYLPLDSFYKYVGLGLSFTHYFTESLGWEILNASTTANISTDLESDIARDFPNAQVQEKSDVIDYYGSTSIVYTPFYSKHLFQKESILYGETSGVLGIGITKFEKAGFVNTVDFGLIFRFVLGRTTSLKVDFRDTLGVSGKVTNILKLGVGLSYNFGNPRAGSQKSNDD